METLISSFLPVMSLVIIATARAILKNRTRCDVSILSLKIQHKSPAVWSSITWKQHINRKYVASWLKIKKKIPTHDLVKDLQTILNILARSHQRNRVKNELIKLGKKKFKAYQKERSSANNCEIIAPISATPPSVVVAGLTQLLKPSKEDVVCDLGCGDGRWLIQAARDYGCRCVGVDCEESRLSIGRVNAAEAGVKDLVTLTNGDIFATDLSDCTMVICYLFGESTGKVRRKVLQTLRHGALVLSVSFQFHEEEGEEEEKEEDKEGRRRRRRRSNQQRKIGYLELIQTLSEGVERKLLLYRWVKPELS